jgi:tetratricopeptide (TPR) repeat protein/Mrp family chromosome partitioning ATPase
VKKMDEQPITGSSQTAKDQYDTGLSDKPAEIPPAKFMTAVAWYSFKGGVGRSMSLANVCSLLARHGYRVGVIDLDLEAPGLHAIPPFHVEADTRRGVLGYLSDLIKKKCSINDVGDYVRDIKADAPGKIYFLRAGPRDTEDYVSRLAAVRDSGIFGSDSADGLYYLDQMKQWFRRKLNVHYLLVDARTGYSEMGGASTLLLGDIVVLVTGLNENNLDSLKNPLLLIDKYRPEKNFRKRIIPLVTIASPGETQWSFETRHQAAQTLADCSEPIEVPPWTGAAFRAGSIVTEPWSPDSLTAAYSKLVSRIIQISKDLNKETAAEEAAPSDAERRLTAAKLLLEENPGDPLAHSGYGELLLKSGQKKQGFAELRKAVKLAPGNTFILEKLAKYLAEDEQFQEAAKIYRKLLKQIKHSPVTYANLVIAKDAVFYSFLAAQESKDDKAYRRTMRQCEDILKRFFPGKKSKDDLSVDEQGPYISISCTYARCLSMLEEKEKAEEIFVALTQMFPDDWFAFDDYLTFLWRNKNYDRYEKITREALDRGFRIMEVLPSYINALLKKNKAQEALRFLQGFRPEQGKNAVLSHLAGVVFQGLGFFEQAISSCRQATQIDPSYRAAFVDLANLYWGTKQHEEAIEVASTIIERFNKYYMGHIIRAEALTDLGRYRDAIPDIKTIVGSGNENKAFLNRAALAAEESGDINLAETCHRSMLKQPDLSKEERAVTLAKYAYLIVKHFPKRLDEAVEMIKESQTLAPMRDAVAATASVVELYRAKNMPVEELGNFQLLELVSLAKKEGKAPAISNSNLWEVLDRIGNCEKCDGETRLIALITLAKGVIEDGDFERGSELIGQLKSMEIPESFAPIMHDLQLTLYGKDKTKEPKEVPSKKTVQKTFDFSPDIQVID